ncbi:MAG: CPXCG motif-containing cysteine-rich protein [Longimicrobiales bacterium]|nr:CPXCG motif-containing cysteine-rich protein [Longimicrobiales bacterium]
MSDLFDEWGVDDDEYDDDFDDGDDPDEGEDPDEAFELEGFVDDDEDLEEGDVDLDLADLDVDDEELDDDDLDSELAGSVEVSCPYCGAGVELVVDPVGGDFQEYVEDCEVCCQPWSVRVTLNREGLPSVDLSTLDEG